MTGVVEADLVREACDRVYRRDHVFGETTVRVAPEYVLRAGTKAKVPGKSKGDAIDKVP